MAWNEWIKGASSYQNPINRESKKCKTFADEDSEAEYEWQVEEEHWGYDTEFETLTPYYYDSEKGFRIKNVSILCSHYNLCMQMLLWK